MRTNVCIALLLSVSFGCATAMKPGRQLPGSYTQTVIELKKELPVIPEIDGSVPTYTVENGDSLWKISEKVYGDPFLWPSLTSSIVNVDCIEPGQKITYMRNLSIEAKGFIETAKQRAKYIPHTCK